MPFLTEQFPSVLKTAKVIPVYEINLKLIMQIIDQYPFYLILKRLLKKSCTKDCLIFWMSAI